MAYLLSSIYTKNYWNRTTVVEIIVGGWVVSFFETQCKFAMGHTMCRSMVDIQSATAEIRRGKKKTDRKKKKPQCKYII